MKLELSAVALLLSGPALAQDKPPVMVRAESCLRVNVDRVVATDADPLSAANFLLNFSCVSEVASAARYVANLVQVKHFTSADAAKARAQGTEPVRASVDPNTGDIVMPPVKPNSPVPPEALFLARNDDFKEMFLGVVPVSLRKLAGDLVLQARERLKTGR